MESTSTWALTLKLASWAMLTAALASSFADVDVKGINSDEVASTSKSMNDADADMEFECGL